MTKSIVQPATTAEQVRLGATAPALPKADTTKVRLGATAPALPRGEAAKLRCA